MLKEETEDNIVEYLRTQGVTACKRFKIKMPRATRGVEIGGCFALVAGG